MTNERDPLTLRASRLELGLVVAGLTVVAGLAAEYGPEMIEVYEKGQWPRIGLVGGILVIFGVFAEVLIGIAITRNADKIKERSDADIARSNECSASALKAAADANERASAADAERVRLELEILRLKTPRSLSSAQQRSIADALRRFGPIVATLHTTRNVPAPMVYPAFFKVERGELDSGHASLDPAVLDLNLLPVVMERALV